MAIWQLLTCIVESKRYTVYSRYIAELDNRGPMLDPIFGAQERNIFCEIGVTP